MDGNFVLSYDHFHSYCYPCFCITHYVILHHFTATCSW